MEEILHIYGNTLSQPVRSILIFCRFSNIQYEYHHIDLLKGENRSEEFSKINPFKEVPAIVHGDFKLNESAAILTYLADAYNIDNQ